MSMSLAGAHAYQAFWAVSFWVCAALLVYVYLGYPALAWARAALAPSPALGVAALPFVSVIVVAHDEADRIAARIDNLLALDYPRDRLEILIASDGSTDGTAERARAYAQDGVAVHAFAARRGKPAVLNDVVPRVSGAIVVLADARQRFEPGTVRALTRPFADPAVGAVSGELILTEAPGGATVGCGVGVYWRYEKHIRKSESRVDSTVGATGAVYAIRRELFEPIPEDTLLDDVLIPLHIVRRGYRVLFEPAARAWDRVAASAEEELARKVRTLAGNFQLFWRAPWLLDPRRNRIWLATVSHKGLRLLGPGLHAGAFVASAVLADVAFYRAALVAQAAFYGMALGGHATRNALRRSALLSIPYVVCLLNWATVVGFFRFCTGRQRATWARASGAARPVTAEWRLRRR
jgi:cellulose synthase/poly-beta-1,6-N-acetylglucosamine synthase-like glycosyltransferase